MTVPYKNHGRRHAPGGSDPIPLGSFSPGQTTQIRVPILDTPDFSGYAYPSLTTSSVNGFANVQRLLPYFSYLGDGSWTGSIRVPDEYGSAAVVTISAVVNATSGAVRWKIGSAAVASGESEDTSFTNETAQNVTVPGTALRRFDTAFTLSTSISAGDDLNIKVIREASNGADTCNADAGVWAVTFSYTIG